MGISAEITVLVACMAATTLGQTWILASSNASISSTDYASSTRFNAPQTGTMSGIRLVYNSGFIDLSATVDAGKWGYGGNSNSLITVFLMKANPDIIGTQYYPTIESTNATMDNPSWFGSCTRDTINNINIRYSLTGYSSDSLQLDIFKPEYTVSINDQFTLQTTEAYCATDSGDNSGTTYTEVYFLYDSYNVPSSTTLSPIIPSTSIAMIASVTQTAVTERDAIALTLPMTTELGIGSSNPNKQIIYVIIAASTLCIVVIVIVGYIWRKKYKDDRDLTQHIQQNEQMNYVNAPGSSNVSNPAAQNAVGAIDNNGNNGNIGNVVRPSNENTVQIKIADIGMEGFGERNEIKQQNQDTGIPMKQVEGATQMVNANDVLLMKRQSNESRDSDIYVKDHVEDDVQMKRPKEQHHNMETTKDDKVQNDKVQNETVITTSIMMK